jgi:hypothetical protein
MAQSHRARPLILNSTFGIKSQFSAKKIFTFRLTGQETGVYIPGRDISEMPEDIERTEMLDFLLGILIPLKLLLLAWFAWQLLGWLL